MFTGKYKFADVTVEITTHNAYVHKLCCDYVTYDDVREKIVITAGDIERERSECRNSDGNNADAFSDGYMEFIAVHRKLAVMLLDYDILLMHGSAISADGYGLLFTAHSGTGKSTHTRLWREMLGDSCCIINDDKPFVFVPTDKRKFPVIYGSPWDGKHNLSSNIHRPLKAIVLLERGEANEIHEISSQEMLPTILEQTFRTDDAEVTAKVLNLLSHLMRKVKFYQLHCNMEPQAAKVAYQAIMRR